MATLLRFYAFSLVFTAACLALGAWYGYASTGTIEGLLSILWIVIVLSILEVSLSFDNAVVNATVLREMDPVWQRRFLTWGILIAVFGMRIVFPVAIVAIAAGLGPIEAIRLSLDDPVEYERIVTGAHVAIAGFGGAFGVRHHSADVAFLAADAGDIGARSVGVCVVGEVAFGVDVLEQNLVVVLE